MIRTVTELDLSAPFDICIVGGGAAGLTMAAALDGSELSVLVLESGNRKPTPEGQAFFRGELANNQHSPTDSYRVRALGGASQLWGGRCVPYDPIDFEERPWVGMPGWPIPYATVAAYYPRAQEAAEAGPFDYRAEPMVPGLEGPALETTLERFSRPTDFSRRYGDLLAASANVTVALDATVTHIQLAADGTRVDHLQVAAGPPGGARIAVHARDYVLAAGGLEVTRLLLNADDVHRDGIGNARGWVGRCYMCHTAATVGVVTFTGEPTAIRGDYERDAGGVYLRRRIGVTAEAQRRLQILNLCWRLHLHEVTDPSHNDSVLSFLYHARYFVKYEYSRKHREARLSLLQHAWHYWNVIRHPVRLARFLATFLPARYLQERRVPSIVLFSPDNRYAIEFHAEQEPHPDSRVTLTDTRDAYGLRTLRVDWRASPLDIDTVRRGYQLLADELERTGTGRLEYSDAAIEAAIAEQGAYGGHHIGTARMSADPALGVVDVDGRVHDVANLFIASAAIMPTSSQANPTLTVLALACRMADHLRARAGARREVRQVA